MRPLILKDVELSELRTANCATATHDFHSDPTPTLLAPERVCRGKGQPQFLAIFWVSTCVVGRPMSNGLAPLHRFCLAHIRLENSLRTNGFHRARVVSARVACATRVL